MQQHAPAEGETVSDEDLSFKVVKDLGAHDELLALAATMPIARRAFQAAVIPARRSSYANAPASWSAAVLSRQRGACANAARGEKQCCPGIAVAELPAPNLGRGVPLWFPMAFRPFVR
jgi:hypothetical protein